MRTLPTDERLASTNKLTELPVVLVRWVDSASMGRWRGFKETRENAIVIACTSVGFLVINSEKQITLAESISAEGHCIDTISIPRGCVLSVTVLRRGRKRKP